MTIQKRLILSNILMIVIPACLALIFGAVAFKTSGNSYWESFEEMYSDQDEIYSAQSVIYLYKEELMEQNKVSYDAGETESSMRFLEESRKLGSLGRELEDMSYQYQVMRDGGVLLGNLSEEAKNLIEEYLEGDYKEITNLSMNTEQGAIIKNSFEIEGKIWEIAAVRLKNEVQDEGTGSYFRKYMTRFAILFVLFCLLAVALTNALLSRHIRNMILRPLRLLQEGARKVADGELDWEIDYHRPDEFGEVCREFDEMRAHLKEAVQTKQEYEQYRQELLSGISHDLRTPLTSIKGYAEGLRDGIADTEEMKRRYYEAIHIRALDMERLLDSLSMLSRLERRYRYDLEPICMKEYLEQFLDDYHEEALQKGADISLVCRAEHTRILGDVQELRRVFVNLLENSIKYREKERSRIQVLLEDGQEELVIQVSDDGPGVPEEELSHIFTSFYRGDQARTRPGEGSGLGLSIVKKIIEGHHGTITARNMQGLTMTICLPLQKGDAE